MTAETADPVILIINRDEQDVGSTFAGLFCPGRRMTNQNRGEKQTERHTLTCSRANHIQFPRSDRLVLPVILSAIIVQAPLDIYRRGR